MLNIMPKIYPKSSSALLLCFLIICLHQHSLNGFKNIDNKIDSFNEMNFKLSERRRLVGDVYRNTAELIRGHGYPAEVHEVVTRDGYILEMHRIPHGMNESGERPRPVAYLQHCLLCSSSDWLMNTPDKAIAYMLADAGYDVWLGNARGNTYSKRHRVLSTRDPLFWEFSWAEMGRYDAPASIDYVLNITGQEQLYFIGFSMGTTVFFTMMNYHPQYNDKIIGMVALAPVAYVKHVKGPLGTMMPFVNYFVTLLDMAGVHELLPSGEGMERLVSSFCASTDITAPICHNILFAITGADADQLNQDYLPVILSHTPAGTSVRTLIHYMQNGLADRFQDFDYGFFGNFRRYGQPTPREFNMSKVTAPVAVFFAEADWLAPIKDVKRMVQELPNPVLVHKVQNKNFTHLDFVWARDARSLVYKPMMKALKLFTSRKAPAYPTHNVTTHQPHSDATSQRTSLHVT